MYEKCIRLLEMRGIELEKGLTVDELLQIEEIYSIQFPKSFKEFLNAVLPISKGFYNWRNLTEDNIEFIRQTIKRPIEDVYNMAEEVYWCYNWGEEPKEEIIIAKEVRERLNKAPKLLPIYGHRYMPIILDDDPPIISVHNTDIIYYGINLEDYFEVEFGKKKQDTIDFHSINPIPFWSDIM